MTEQLLVERRDGVLHVTFNRPEQRNAMTFEMYEGLVEACAQADADPAVRLIVLRGAGGEAFVAGTDIKQFEGFDGEKGIAYEKQIDATIGRLLATQTPILAAIGGFCVGGGLAIASAADIRIATPGSKFGYPIARTLGNTLSAASYSLALRHFGHARTIAMVMGAQLIAAEELRPSGFVAQIVDDLDAGVADWSSRILSHAPLTMWAGKEILRRVHDSAAKVDSSDVIARVYGSEDFAAGVSSFTTKVKPTWQGR